MGSVTPRHSREEFASRAEAIVVRDIEPRLRSEDPRKFVLIDIETGDYEIDADEMSATDRLLTRRPDAQIWLRRVGLPYAYRFGARLTLNRRSED